MSRPRERGIWSGVFAAAPGERARMADRFEELARPRALALRGGTG
ncbi:MAG TPA: hypothetical protein VGB87_21595 [Vicinamibacteria bacterium]